jgi:hypothetical protein
MAPARNHPATIKLKTRRPFPSSAAHYVAPSALSGCRRVFRSTNRQLPRQGPRDVRVRRTERAFNVFTASRVTLLGVRSMDVATLTPRSPRLTMARTMPIWEVAVRDGLVRIENGVTAVNRPAETLPILLAGAVLQFGMRARMRIVRSAASR